jgi:hypothetical protein
MYMPDCLVNNEGFSISKNEDSMNEHEDRNRSELMSASLLQVDEIVPAKIFSDHIGLKTHNTINIKQNRITSDVDFVESTRQEEASLVMAKNKLDRVASPDEDLEEEKDIVPGYTDHTDRRQGAD